MLRLALCPCNDFAAARNPKLVNIQSTFERRVKGAMREIVPRMTSQLGWRACKTTRAPGLVKGHACAGDAFARLQNPAGINSSDAN